MRAIDQFVRFGLVLMVIISLFLSWQIWTNSSSYHTKNQGNSVASIQKKEYSEVFLPTKLILHEGNQNRMTNKESLISDNIKELKKFKLHSYQVLIDNDEAKFNTILQMTDTIEYTFPDNIHLRELIKVLNYKGNITDFQEEFLFTRMIVSLKENVIYFLQINNFQVVTLSFDGDSAVLRDQVEKIQNYLSPASYHHDVLPFVYYIDNDIWLQEYSYIAATQPFSMFTQAFFKDNNIRSNDDTEDVNFTNEDGERLIIQNETGAVNFNENFNKLVGDGTEDSFEKSFQYVRQTGSALGNLRYFDAMDDTIVYRNYVEGFPVFGKDNKGKIQVSINKNNDVSISTNVETIQVPIPSDVSILLPNTQKVIEELLNNGAVAAKITDIQIGYTWENNPETTQIVNLKPEWYIKYENEWTTVLQLLSELKKGGQG